MKDEREYGDLRFAMEVLGTLPDAKRRRKQMKRTLALSVFVTSFLGLSGSAAPAKHVQGSNAEQVEGMQVFEVAAKKYEFTPEEIHVKKGRKVQLKVHSTDEDHGIKLNLYPEGSKDKSSPGLVFDSPQNNGKVEKVKDQVLVFVAQQVGTYEFKCAKVCGIHHGRMKGKLIVEE